MSSASCAANLHEQEITREKSSALWIVIKVSRAHAVPADNRIFEKTVIINEGWVESLFLVRLKKSLSTTMIRDAWVKWINLCRSKRKDWGKVFSVTTCDRENWKICRVWRKKQAASVAADKKIVNRSFNESCRSIWLRDNWNKCGLWIIRSAASDKDYSVGVLLVNMLIFVALLAIHAGFAGESRAFN